MSTVTSATDLNPTAASLLGYLGLGPMTGWDLDQWVRVSIGNFWNVTRSQIYRELRTLTERGYVKAGASGPRDRVPYTITDAGSAAFRAWIAESPGPDLIRSRLLLTIFFGDHVEPERLREILAEQRKEHEAQLESYKALQEAIPESERFSVATLKFGLRYEQNMVEWLTELEKEATQEGPGGAQSRRRRPVRPVKEP
jgi:DNA-binding PadR family transcriptional regulator